MNQDVFCKDHYYHDQSYPAGIQHCTVCNNLTGSTHLVVCRNCSTKHSLCIRCGLKVDPEESRIRKEKQKRDHDLQQIAECYWKLFLKLNGIQYETDKQLKYWKEMVSFKVSEYEEDQDPIDERFGDYHFVFPIKSGCCPLCQK